jgi:hypothetical protein
MEKIYLILIGLVLLGVVVWLFNAFIRWIRSRERKKKE